MELSRSEKILSSKISGDDYTDPPQSRLEKLLLQMNTSTGTDTTELTKDVQSLKNSVGYLDTAMTKNANNISGVKSSVTAVQNKIMTLGEGVDELNRNIRDIQEDVIRIEDHAILDSYKDNKS